MAVHAPITGAPLRAPIIPEVDLTRSSRAAIGDEIERLLTILDRFDGDEDMELEEDFGPDDTEKGDGERDPLRMLPRYGVDQSTGPINEREALRAHHRALYAPEARS